MLYSDMSWYSTEPDIGQGDCDEFCLKVYKTKKEVGYADFSCTRNESPVVCEEIFINN